jgi:two-component system sensor histidine kinase DctS
MKNPLALPRAIPLSGLWRWLLPLLIVLLFLAVLFWLPWQARQMETNERQEQLIADTLWVEQTLRFELTRNEEAIGVIGSDLTGAGLAPATALARLAQLRNNSHELERLLLLDAAGHVVRAADDADATAAGAPPLSAASRAAADIAAATHKGRYSEPYAGAKADTMLVDYHLPLLRDGQPAGSLVASYNLRVLLEDTVPWWFAHDNAIALLDRDDTVVAQRAAGGPGRGVYTHKRALELTGASLTLSTDSVKSVPQLLPNLLVGSVVVLALGLLASLAALWRHIARRLAAEGALRQQVAFRTAMENSLVTGLRARDLEGRVTYVNPAFCQIVGLPAEELVGKAPPMPYWAPEAMTAYQQRLSGVLAGNVTPQFETIFQRADGARVPVLIFEAPLVDSSGRQTGWMGSVLDISDRRRAEDLSRQQQEKLQASARLATMGEIASMLAHELNQPLAAISSYTTGALNVLARAPTVDADQLRPALEQASLQAQRAGQIIRSVHEFVKKREPQRRALSVQQLVDGIRTLIELQARQSFVRVDVEIPADLPAVSADRMMLEQVLLNLTRNAMEAMHATAPERRILRIGAVVDDGQVVVSVSDHGHGIAPEVAACLYAPFFSTKAEGMGMGLSICRTAVEFHGGTLRHSANADGGTTFAFALPAHAG